MPYIVNFTDNQKQSITVYDNTSNTDTSIQFPGRNVTGYGQIIAENFLHLLENFANDTAPINPVEGQLWYDTQAETLKISDGINWKASGSVQTGPVEPAVAQSNVGELWVDTSNQQLYLFTGSRWILVGPVFSTGLRSGPIVESIEDSDNISRVVLIFYVEDAPVIIFSKDSFVPKLKIDGFDLLRSGINITSDEIDSDLLKSKLWGTASSAENLIVADSPIAASKFLRSDVTNTTEFPFIIRNNSGITIGTDINFNLSSTSTASKIYNSAAGSSIDLQINRNGSPYTTLRVIDNKVGINITSPDEALEVDGNAVITNTLILPSTADSINFSSGSIQAAGGAAIGKTLRVGDDVHVDGISNLRTVIPKENDTYDLGTSPSTGGKRWNTIRAKTLDVDQIIGDVEGNISGNSSTATNLKSVTTFKLEGDVISNSVQFDGAVGGIEKTFVTTITADIISDKPEPLPNRSQTNDTILVFRSGTGFLRETRDVFIADLGVPVGSLMPYAGQEAPDGYLLCDGSEIEKRKYPALYSILGNIYNGSIPLVGVETFRLPDLRGRFPLGKDNMDNGSQVPNSTGGFLDGGGGNADRVDGIAADNLGQFSGQAETSITTENLPDHEHNMKGSTGQQYFAVNDDNAIPLDSGATLKPGPGGAPVQYLPSSGGVKTIGNLGEPISVMNPFLTLNYIIRSGPPEF